MTLLLGLLLAAPAAPAPIVTAPVDPAAPLIRTPPIAPTAAPPTRAEPAVPLPRLITDADYPAAAMRAREQGTVAVVLDIAAEGRVTNCTITASSRSAILDATTCRILRARARFTPARDTSGKAVADRFETKLTWRMNASAPLVPPAVHAAMTSWSQCIGPMLTRGIGNKALSARAIAERAFTPCRAEEDRMLAVIREAVDAPRPIEQDRALLRQQVVDRIEAARTARQP